MLNLLGALQPVSLLCIAEKFVSAVMYLKVSSSSNSFGGPGYSLLDKICCGKSKKKQPCLFHRASWANLTYMLIQPELWKMSFGLVIATDVDEILLDGSLAIDLASLKGLHHLACISRSRSSLKQINRSALTIHQVVGINEEAVNGKCFRHGQ